MRLDREHRERERERGQEKHLILAASQPGLPEGRSSECRPCPKRCAAPLRTAFVGRPAPCRWLADVGQVAGRRTASSKLPAGRPRRAGGGRLHVGGRRTGGRGAGAWPGRCADRPRTRGRGGGGRGGGWAGKGEVCRMKERGAGVGGQGEVSKQHALPSVT